MLVVAEYEIEKNWEDLCCMLDELIYIPNHALIISNNSWYTLLFVIFLGNKQILLKFFKQSWLSSQ